MSFQERQLLQLGEKKILNENGDSVTFSSLWKEDRIVLVFLRHFG